MRINAAGLEILKKFEGLRLDAYRDVAGVWTIGWGHTGDVKPGMRVTKHQAGAILDVDLDKFERGVGDLVHVANENQFSALVSLAFNIGLGALGKSTLLKRFNNGEHYAAGNEFLKWRLSAGKVQPGLVKRRVAERALFLTRPAPIQADGNVA